MPRPSYPLAGSIVQICIIIKPCCKLHGPAGMRLSTLDQSQQSVNTDFSEAVDYQVGGGKFFGGCRVGYRDALCAGVLCGGDTVRGVFDYDADARGNPCSLGGKQE